MEYLSTPSSTSNFQPGSHGALDYYHSGPLSHGFDDSVEAQQHLFTDPKLINDGAFEQTINPQSVLDERLFNQFDSLYEPLHQIAVDDFSSFAFDSPNYDGMIQLAPASDDLIYHDSNSKFPLDPGQGAYQNGINSLAEQPKNTWPNTYNYEDPQLQLQLHSIEAIDLHNQPVPDFQQALSPQPLLPQAQPSHGFGVFPPPSIGPVAYHISPINTTAFRVPSQPLPSNSPANLLSIPQSIPPQHTIPVPLDAQPHPPAAPEPAPIKRRRRRRKPPPPPEVAAAKHKAFLQRNREAASKCRTKKRAQVDELKDVERMAREVNKALTQELQELMESVLTLREQEKMLGCEEECGGCGDHAPIRKGSVPAQEVRSDILASMLMAQNRGVEQDDDEEEEDEEDDEE